MSESCYRCRFPIGGEIIEISEGMMVFSYWKFFCKACNIRWTRLSQ